MRGLALLLLLAVILGPAPARAVEGEDAHALAKAHLDAGNAYFTQQRWSDAIREYKAGHALLPNRHFMFNIAVAYEKLGDAASATEWYRGYMATLAPDSPDRAKIKQKLEELQPPPPPTPAPAPAAADTAARAVEVAAPAPPPADKALRPSRPKPLNRVGVGLAVLGVVGLALGAAFIGVAVNADRTIQSPPPRWVYDPGLVKRRDTLYPTGLTVGAIGLASIVGASISFGLARKVRSGASR